MFDSAGVPRPLVDSVLFEIESADVVMVIVNVLNFGHVVVFLTDDWRKAVLALLRNRQSIKVSPLPVKGGAINN